MLKDKLHPQVLQAWNDLHQSESTLEINCVDYNFILASCLSLVKTSISEDRNCVIIVSNNYDRDHIIKICEKAFFNYLDVFRQSELTEKNISHIRSQFKTKDQKDFNNNDRQKLRSIIDLVNLNLAQSFIGDRSLSDLCNQFALNEIHISALPIVSLSPSHLDYSKKEFYYLIGRIEKAAKLYNSNLDHQLEHKHLFDSDTLLKLNSERSRSRIVEYLEMYLIKGLELQAHLSELKRKIFVDFETKLILDFENLKQLLHEVIEGSQDSKIVKNGFLGFTKAEDRPQEGKLQQINELRNCLGLNAIDDSDFSSTHTLQLILEDLKEKKLKIIGSKIQEDLRSINTLNTSDNHIALIQDDLRSWTDKINKLSIFHSSIEINSNNLEEQIKATKRIIEKLKHSLLTIENALPVFEWLSFQDDLPKFLIDFIEEIKIYPKNLWTKIFEQWYLRHCLVFFEGSIDIHKLKSIYRSNDFNIDESQSQKTNIRLKSEIEKIRSTDKSLFQELIKKKQPRIDFGQLLQSSDIIQNAFDVTIINAKDVNQDSIKDRWDVILDLSLKEWNLSSEISHHLKFSKKGNTLNGYILSDKNLSELQSSNQLKEAKKIALELLKINQQLIAYQSKSESLISCWSPTVTEMYLAKNRDEEFKLMPLGASLFDTITEALLETDKKRTLLLNNGLINPRPNQSKLYEISMEHYLEDKGLVIENLSIKSLISTRHDFNTKEKDDLNLVKNESLKF